MAKPLDTAGEREIELSELAQLCATVLGRRDIQIERPSVRGDQVDRYVGDGTAMHTRAARYGITLATLPGQINETANFLRQTFTGPRPEATP
jgi:hypothetical protein